MGELAEALKKRTMKFALDACVLIRQLDREEPGPTVRKAVGEVVDVGRAQLPGGVPRPIAR